MESTPSWIRRDTLVSEVWNLEDLGKCFDFRAFPLPLRLGPRTNTSGFCFECPGNALHLYMRVRPRGRDELPTLARDADGTLELNTCTRVTQEFLTDNGPRKAVERIRQRARDLVLHELYEALLFRGERIMDPHDLALRPIDQPF